MSPVEAAMWGAAGGLVVEALELVGQIRRNKGRWPWTGRRLWPSVLAVGLRVGVSALVAAAMSDQFAGQWPAFCIGVAAPVVVSRLAENVPPVGPGSGAER